MQTTVIFKSRAFPKYPNEDDETVNETRWGKRLAEFIRDNLPKHGVPTGEILCEDWGWLVNIPNESFPVWIGCGPLDDEGDPLQEDDLIEFSMFAVAEPGILKRLFGRVNTGPALEMVTKAMRNMIENSEDFQDPVWSD